MRLRYLSEPPASHHRKPTTVSSWSSSRQGALHVKPNRDDPPDGFTLVRGGSVLEPDDIHLLKVLRHAFAASQLVVWHCGGL